MILDLNITNALTKFDLLEPCIYMVNKRNPISVICLNDNPDTGSDWPGGEGGGVPPQAPCLIKFIRIDIDLYIR